MELLTLRKIIFIKGISYTMMVLGAVGINMELLVSLWLALTELLGATGCSEHLLERESSLILVAFNLRYIFLISYEILYSFLFC